METGTEMSGGETEMGETEITFEGFEGRAARDRLGEHAEVVLDPESRSCWVLCGIGNGVPAMLWHRRAISFRVDAGACLEDVEEVLRAHLDEIAEIFANYGGSEWNGNNLVGLGSWGEGSGELVEALALACSEEGAVRTYWDAEEWLAPAHADMSREVAARVRRGASPRAACAEVAANEADTHEAVLDADELETAIWGIYSRAVYRLIDGCALGSDGLEERDVGTIADWIGDYGIEEAAMAALCQDTDELESIADAYVYAAD